MVYLFVFAFAIKFHGGISHPIRQLFYVHIDKAQFVIDGNCIWGRIHRNCFIFTILAKIFPQLSPNSLPVILGFYKKAADVFSIFVCSDYALQLLCIICSPKFQLFENFLIFDKIFKRLDPFL